MALTNGNDSRESLLPDGGTFTFKISLKDCTETCIKSFVKKQPKQIASRGTYFNVLSVCARLLCLMVRFIVKNVPGIFHQNGIKLLRTNERGEISH